MAQKIFKINDFDKLDCFMDGLAFKNKKCYTFGIKLEKNIVSSIDVVRTYYENNSFYIFTADNKLYRLDDEKLSLISENFTSVPDSQTFMYDSAISTIFGTDTKGIMVQNNNITFLDDRVYSFICMHNGMLFTSKDNTIYYSEAYNQLNFSTTKNNGGQILTDKTLGKIIKLISFNSNLYIFCKRAVLKMKACGNEEQNVIIKIMETANEINEKSVLKVENSIIFCSRNQIYKMDEKENFSRICEFMDNSVCQFQDNYAGNHNGMYVSEFFVNESPDKFVLIYDPLKDVGCFLDTGAYLIKGDSIFDSTLNKIGTVNYLDTLFGKDKDYSIKIKRTYFDSDKFKKIHKVNVKGEFSSSEIFIDGSYSSAKLSNIKPDNKYVFEAEGETFGVNIKIKNLVALKEIDFIGEEINYDI